MKRVLTVIGARPQWMKASALSRALKDNKWGIEERVLHTGQHYSENMAGRFIEELDLPRAHHTLHVTHEPALRMGQMMEGILRAIQSDAPDAVLLFGDTDSTLAGAWAASRSGVPAVHVEAGLRSFDRNMPEEVNRVLTDAVCDLLFCPSQAAVDLLKAEGIATGSRPGLRVEISGDLMLDTARHFGGAAEPLVKASKHVLMTLHRPSNVDDSKRLKDWIEAAGATARSNEWKVVFPVHPRTAASAERAFGPNWKEACADRGIEVHDPAGYLQMLHWLKSVRQVWTDSGGLQKEAYFMGRPAVVCRGTTEWTELVDLGVTTLAPHPDQLEHRAMQLEQQAEGLDFSQPVYGDGESAAHIAKTLQEWLNQ